MSTFNRRPLDPNKYKGSILGNFAIANAVNPRGAQQAQNEGGGGGENAPFDVIGQRPPQGPQGSIPAPAGMEGTDLEEAFRRHLLSQALMQSRQMDPSYLKSLNADRHDVNRSNILSDTVENIGRASAQLGAVPGHTPESTLKFDRQQYQPGAGDAPQAIDSNALGYLTEMQKARNQIGLKRYDVENQNARQGREIENQNIRQGREIKSSHDLQAERLELQERLKRMEIELQEYRRRIPDPNTAESGSSIGTGVQSLKNYIDLYIEKESQFGSGAKSKIPGTEEAKFKEYAHQFLPQISTAATGKHDSLTVDSLPTPSWDNTQATIAFEKLYENMIERQQGIVNEEKARKKDTTQSEAELEKLEIEYEEISNKLRKLKKSDINVFGADNQTPQPSPTQGSQAAPRPNGKEVIYLDEYGVKFRGKAGFTPEQILQAHPGWRLENGGL